MKKKRQPLRQRAFLQAYAICGCISTAARAAKIDRRRHYEWMGDWEYAEAFEQAHLEACEALEAEARRRAVEGWQEPVVHQGQFTYEPKINRDGTVRMNRRGETVCSDTPLTVRKFSDTLLIFLMKGAMPDKYRDQVKVEHSGQLDVLVERLAAGRKRVAEAESK